MEWLLLAAGLLLIAGTGFFVAVEFSLIALDQPTVQRAVDDGDAADGALGPAGGDRRVGVAGAVRGGGGAAVLP